MANKGFIEDTVKPIFNGDRTLGFTFWAINVVGSIIVGLPMVIASASLDNMSSTIAYFVLAYLLFYVCYIVFALISLWNCSGKYIQFKLKKSEGPFWGYAAKVLVVISLLSLLVQIIRAFIYV